MIRKAIIVLLILGAVGTAGVWVASCTIVGQGFEQYEGVHGVSQTFRYSGGSLGWVASDAIGNELALIISTRLDSSDVVQEGFAGFCRFRLEAFRNAISGGPVFESAPLHATVGTSCSFRHLPHHRLHPRAGAAVAEAEARPVRSLRV